MKVINNINISRKGLILFVILLASATPLYFAVDLHLSKHDVSSLLANFAGTTNKQEPSNVSLFQENNRLILNRHYKTISPKVYGDKEEHMNRSNGHGFVETQPMQNHLFLCHHKFGRLGNTLFDFASSFGIASTLNYTFVMPRNNPLLNLFEITLPIIKKKPENLRTISLYEWRHEWWGNNGSYRAFNLTLKGLYRVWSYFHNVKGPIRKMLTIRSQYLEKAKHFLKLNVPGNRTLIGVHVRRGDVLSGIWASIGLSVAGKNYILSAMSFFQQKYDNSLFVVVSNDKLWCKNNLASENVVISDNEEAIVDLAILMLCNHTIITSGTFGWWGGWLSGGDVVYWTGFPTPGSHVEKHHFFTGEYYPPDWTGLDGDAFIP